MKQVILAKTAGFCYGVRRAVELAHSTAEKEPNGSCRMLGDLIHNRHVVEELEQVGIEKTLEPETLGSENVVIIRSHGELKSTLDQLEKKGVKMVNATCPNVSRIQNLVAEAEREGRISIIIGEPNHPEVMGIASWCAGAVVLSGPEAVLDYLNGNPALRE